MITCAELEELVANYLDGLLSKAMRRDLERHVSGCGACRDFLAGYRRTVWVAKKALETSSHPGQAPERLVQAILGSLGGQPFCR